MRTEKKERFGIFDVKSIPLLENRIMEIQDMLKSKQALDKETINVLVSMLSATEKLLIHLKKQLPK